jgi:small subunit ribosomal protein S20
MQESTLASAADTKTTRPASVARMSTPLGWRGFESAARPGYSYSSVVCVPARPLGASRAPTVSNPGNTDPSEAFRVANIKSQIKRNKQNEKARQRNKAVKSSLKTAVRGFREAADAGDTDKANEALRAAYVKLDKAASKGVIHKNQAANRKSALAKRISALG